jgi:hypothetical protein
MDLILLIVVIFCLAAVFGGIFLSPWFWVLLVALLLLAVR